MHFCNLELSSLFCALASAAQIANPSAAQSQRLCCVCELSLFVMAVTSQNIDLQSGACASDTAAVSSPVMTGRLDANFGLDKLSGPSFWSEREPDMHLPMR